MKRFKEILCVADPEQDSRPTLDRAVALAGNNQANLTVISVIEDIPSDVDMPDGTKMFEDLRIELVSIRAQQLESLVAPYKDRIDTQLKVLTGTPFMEIIREVLRYKYDLLIKTIEKKDWLQNLFGSDDMHLLRMNPCPVWLIREEAPESFQRILATVDVDESYAPAKREMQQALNVQILEMGGSLALSEFAELHIAHVWDAFEENFMRRALQSKPEEEIIAYAERVRQQREENLRALILEVDEKSGNSMMDYIKPQTHVVKGWARKVIPELANQIDADLVVMGTVARSGIPGFIIGNTAESILNQINCSVLAIKPPGFVSPVTLEE